MPASIQCVTSMGALRKLKDIFTLWMEVRVS